jgi:hypothetical protein
MITFLTGNISGLLWGLVIAASLPGFNRGHWLPFHATVFIAALIKPFFIALWIVPVLAHGWSWRNFWIGGAGATALIAIYVAVMATRPDLATAWLAALASRHEVGDIGAGLYALLRQVPFLGEAGALLSHTCYALILLALVMSSQVQGKMRYAALLIAAIAVNPRLNAYDYAFAAIPAYYVFSTRLEQLASPRLGTWLSLPAAIVVAGLSSAIFLRSTYLNNIMIILMTAGAIGAATHWDLLARIVTRQHVRNTTGS